MNAKGDQLSNMEIPKGNGDGDDENYTGGWKVDELLQKIKEPPSYSSVLEEIDTSDARLMLFTHPVDPCEDGLTPHEGKELEDQCNCLRKDVKLKLEKLIKLNFGFWGADYYYMTFSAIDENTARAGIYQAAVREYRNEHVLGLFRDCSTEKALAIIYITGAEEHLAAKKKFVQSAKAGISASKESIYDVEC